MRITLVLPSVALVISCVLLAAGAGRTAAHDGLSPLIAVEDDPVPAGTPTPPAGMAYVRGGAVEIGTTPETLSGLLLGRPAAIRKLFLYETPRHSVTLRPYFIGTCEVTSAQYAVFLRDHRVTYDTTDGSLANLDEIAAHLTRRCRDMQPGRAQRVWEQLYFANKVAIWEAFGPRLGAMLVRKGGVVDPVATAARFRYEPLPRGLTLVFHRFPPPRNWLGDRPLTGLENHPVQFVGYNDAERFAEWAGVRLPTEYEWEWAARGPKQYRYPWGNSWHPDASHANWGGKIVDIKFEPMTMPVDTRPEGRSWCGCHHMCGNVAEWTSSWFTSYPGNIHKHTYMGRFVKVIRGGGAGDGESLVLRSACRNHVGAGPNAPPFPDNQFKWVGFRMAADVDPARDALGPIVRRATRSRRVQRHRLDLERSTGAVTRHWVEPTAKPVNGVFALGPSRSLLLVPYRRLLTDDQKADPFKTASLLARRTRTEHPSMILGVLHTGVRLVAVEVPQTGSTDRRRRGRAKAPRTTEGTCPPGTYLLALWWGRPALLDPSRAFVCFLPEPSDGTDAFTVAKPATAARLPTRLHVDPEVDRAELSVGIPIGGRGRTDDLRFELALRLRFPPDALAAAGTWHHSKP